MIKLNNNLLIKLKIAGKKYYFENQLKSETSNPKKTCQILQELLPHEQPTSAPSALQVNSIIVSDKHKIAASFKNFLQIMGTNFFKTYIVICLSHFLPKKTASHPVADLENFKVGRDFKHKTSKIRMFSPKFRVIFRPNAKIQTFFRPKSGGLR